MRILRVLAITGMIASPVHDRVAILDEDFARFSRNGTYGFLAKEYVAILDEDFARFSLCSGAVLVNCSALRSSMRILRVLARAPPRWRACSE